MVFYPNRTFTIITTNNVKREIPAQLLIPVISAGDRLAPKQWVFMHSNTLMVNVRVSTKYLMDFINEDYRLGFNLAYRTVKQKDALSMGFEC